MKINFIYKMNDVYIGRNRRERGGGVAIRKLPIPTSYQKNYIKDERQTNFCEGFPKERREKKFQNFSMVFSL